MEENLKAVFESIGIELMGYGSAIRTPVTCIMRGRDANGLLVEEAHHHVQIKIMSDRWLQKLKGL